ncbi:MAG TPA: ABC transporter ATP-binding protein [Candidatus Limnocylindrales bacterium]
MRRGATRGVRRPGLPLDSAGRTADRGPGAVHRPSVREAALSAELAISTAGLRRDFGALRAVDALDLAVPAGSVFGFLGPNGSGKTTTIRLLLGLLEPTAGVATVLGHDVRRDGARVRERCGALLEHPGLYERLSAADNLEFVGRAWRLPATERLRRMERLLEPLGLWERRHEIVGTWSRGMKQKLAVARALLTAPDLVFLDEPTAGLDPVAAAALRDDLASLARREGVTVFLTTHNLAEAEKLCDLVGVIRRGRLLSVAPPRDIRTSVGASRLVVTGRGLDAALDPVRAQPLVAAASLADGRLTVELDDGADGSGIVALLVGQGVAIDEVRRGSADLEEAFLALMAETADEARPGDPGGGEADAGIARPAEPARPSDGEPMARSDEAFGARPGPARDGEAGGAPVTVRGSRP